LLCGKRIIGEVKRTKRFKPKTSDKIAKVRGVFFLVV